MKHIDVAVAILLNEQQQVLTAWRQPHQHQGGLWEFPGGKREANESRLEALSREVDEELGVQVEAAKPFMLIEHDYGDKQVKLDVWLVSAFRGEARGKEGQTLRWQAISALDATQFPAANKAIIDALKQGLM